MRGDGTTQGAAVSFWHGFRRLHAWLAQVICRHSRIEERTLLGDRDAVATAPVPDQHLYHAGDGAVLTISRRAQRLFQAGLDAKG